MLKIKDCLPLHLTTEPSQPHAPTIDAMHTVQWSNSTDQSSSTH